MAEAKATGMRRNVVAAGIGNVFEWYDFGIYGFFAVFIGHNFFPTSDSYASLLSAFAVFAVGYMARPIGGAVLGNIGDRLGRRTVLRLSMAVMGGATFAVGLLPTYQQIGIAAPMLLVLLRLVQGFAVAGEYSTSTVYLIECAAPERRALVSSWTTSGVYSGLLLGSAVGALISSILSDTQLQDWGWRLPFLLSVVIAVAGFLLRGRLSEIAEISEAEAETKYPALQAFQREWRAILAYTSLIMMVGVGFYMAFVFAVSDLIQHLHLSAARALEINSLALVSLHNDYDSLPLSFG